MKYVFGRDLTRAIKAFEKANVGGYPVKTSDMSTTEFNKLRFGADLLKKTKEYEARMKGMSRGKESNMELQFGKDLLKKLKQYESNALKKR